MADQVSPFFLRELLEILEGGTPTYTSCSVWAMILNEDSTVPDEIATTGKEALSTFTDLDEYSDVSYSRKEITGIGASASGTFGKVDGADPVWTTLGGSASNSPKWVALFIKLAAAADEDDDPNLHMAMVLDAAFTPDGSDYSYVIPASGFLQINGVPS